MMGAGLTNQRHGLCRHVPAVLSHVSVTGPLDTITRRVLHRFLQQDALCQATEGGGREAWPGHQAAIVADLSSAKACII